MGEITSFMSKGIPPKYVERENENTVRVLNQKCNRNFEINYEESRLHDCSKKKVPDDKMLRPGDVLINSTGMGTAGRVAQLYDVPTSTTIDGTLQRWPIRSFRKSYKSAKICCMALILAGL